MKLLRIASAVYFAVGVGVIGGLAGLGWSFVFPAQYTSTAHIEIPASGTDSAAALANAARDPQLLAFVIVTRDLYGGGAGNAVIPPLVDRVRRSLQVQSRADAIDISFTYPDRYKVRSALDMVISLVRRAGRRYQRTAPNRWGQSLDVQPAAVPVRTSGLEQNTLVLLGFVGGLLVNSLVGWFHPAPPTPAAGPAEGSNPL